MDWAGVLGTDVAQVHEDDRLSEALYSFLLAHELAEEPDLAGDAGKVARLVAVMKAVMKVYTRV